MAHRVRTRAGGRRVLRVPLVVWPLLLALACGDSPAEPANTPPAEPETGATAAVVLLSTPVPTATPVNDPLLGEWTVDGGALVLTLSPDGRFRAVAGEAAAEGAYTVLSDTISFVPDGRAAHAVRYELDEPDGTALLLYQEGQEPLAFARGEGTA